ncbi:MAG: hypothetical protein RLO12_01640 [Fulvivirga sp.]
MKPFEKFEISNIMHVSILSYAVDLAQNETLDNAVAYLKERFEIAPLKALEAIFLYNLGHELTSLQKSYVKAYSKALSKHTEKFESVYYYKEENTGDYPDDFDPALYDL